MKNDSTPEATPTASRLPMLASLRSRLILGFLVTSLLSELCVGSIAYFSMMRRFDALAMDDAMRHFSQDAQAYYLTYGSWEAGARREGIRQFVERRRGPMPSGLPENGLLGELQAPPGPQAAQALRPLPGGRREMPPSNLKRAPFRFHLFDTSFRAIFRSPEYQPGDLLPEAKRKALRPVEVQGQTVAWVYPEGEITYSDLDLGYIAALRDALLFGGIGGSLITLALAVLFGNGLSRSLRKLTQAVQAFDVKATHSPHIEVATHDEVGILARSFNKMSEELIAQFRQLHASHDKIEAMALRLRELSIRDPLTGLHNRRYFDEQGELLFKLARRQAHPLCVMVADVDHFKSINDTYSHATGDEVLRQLAAILQKQLRATDLLARYGGEEFVMAFPDTSETQAASLCEALRQRIADHPWHTTHPDLRVTISIGLAGRSDAESLAALVDEADEALYQAKNSGRNQVCLRAA